MPLHKEKRRLPEGESGARRRLTLGVAAERRRIGSETTGLRDLDRNCDPTVTLLKKLAGTPGATPVRCVARTRKQVFQYP